jgi:hypothetical protein
MLTWLSTVLGLALYSLGLVIFIIYDEHLLRLRSIGRKGKGPCDSTGHISFTVIMSF